MADYNTSKIEIGTEIFLNDGTSQSSNPLRAQSKVSEKNILTGYTKTSPKPKFDKDVSNILEIVRILNNMAPLRMPVYNFNFNEINGDYYYKPDGTLLLAREYDKDLIRDYYASTTEEGSVDRILEHDKRTGRLRTKIESIKRAGSRLTTSIAIFDEKLNNKYTIIQLSEGGIVNNISEFTGKGKSFQTLFRNISTFKPARYLEGKDTKELGFVMIDCIFDSEGNIARIKTYSNKKEVCIDYKENQKSITVKNK